MPNHPKFTCPICARSTFNRNDIKYGYCPGCRAFTRDCTLNHDLTRPCLGDVVVVVGNVALCRPHADELGEHVPDRAPVPAR